MFQLDAKVLKNNRVTKEYYNLVLSCPQIARVAQPGQFIAIKVSGGLQPLLRRPFSIHAIGAGSKRRQEFVEILYEVVGKGSELLSKNRPGVLLDILGPLGNGFTQDRSKQPILVAGGMGVAPLLFLAQHLASLKPIVLIGARSKEDVLCEKEFKKLGCTVIIATDNGSSGFKGYVTDLLTKTLSTMDHRRLAIYACGPQPMLRQISRISSLNKIPAQISLEAHMSCGFGVCLGCVVRTRGGYQRVCKEGPVFNADTIVY